MTLEVCQISHFEIQHNSTHSHTVESRNITSPLCELLPPKLKNHKIKNSVTIVVHKNSTSVSHNSNRPSGNQKNQRINQKEPQHKLVKSEHNSTKTPAVHHKKTTHTSLPQTPKQHHSADSGSSISNGAIFGIIFFILVVIAAAVIILRTKWGRPIRAERGGPSEHYNTLPDDMQQANLI